MKRKQLSKKNQATLRAFLRRTSEKYDIALYFGRLSARYLKAASGGAMVGSMAAELIRGGCHELREIVRGSAPVLFREGR